MGDWFLYVIASPNGLPWKQRKGATASGWCRVKFLTDPAKRCESIKTSIGPFLTVPLQLISTILIDELNIDDCNVHKIWNSHMLIDQGCVRSTGAVR